MDNSYKLKYGESYKIEPLSDIYIFFPIAEQLSHLAYKLKLTPNQITYLSLIIQLYSSYQFYYNYNKIAAICYIFGYILDSVDGRLARNYNMHSKYGEALDIVTDYVANAVLLCVKFVKYRNIINIKIIIIYIYLLHIMNIWYGLVEALNNYNKFDNDNFYKSKQLRFTENKLLYNSYLYIQKQSYYSYKFIMPVINKNKVYNMLYYLKTFGPGNYNIMVFFIMLLV